MYRIVEVVGVSQASFDDAVKAAIERVAKSGGQADYFEVIEHRGAIAGGKVKEYQATVKIGVKES